MSTVPLKVDIHEDGIRPRDWEPRRGSLKLPLRIFRLCVLGAFLPAVLVAGPIYLRYRVYSEQVYPLAASDQRLIDSKVSTTWCQVVRANATFNAYLLRQEPEVKVETIAVSMTRHLVLEDDMKEYWGFYLLRGSSVTVSTCVRWPGASLTIIRGHKHLHECAFIGDDSSEELEELVEIAGERGLLNTTYQEEAPSNEPGKMKRVRVGVQFHDKSSTPAGNDTLLGIGGHHLTSHELDANAMRKILTQLFIKTLDTKNKQKENPHHHYEGVYKESGNIDKPPIVLADFGYIADSEESGSVSKRLDATKNFNEEKMKNDTDQKGQMALQDTTPEAGDFDRKDLTVTKNETEMKDEENQVVAEETTRRSPEKALKKHVALKMNSNSTGNISDSVADYSSHGAVPTKSNVMKKSSNGKTKKYADTTAPPEIEKEDTATEKAIIEYARRQIEATEPTSSEVFEDVLKKINSLGDRGKNVLQKLIDEIGTKEDTERNVLRKMVSEVMKNDDNELSVEEKIRRRRELILSSPLHDELNEDDVDGDMAIEEEILNPDGIAEDRGTVNETTLNDRSNSEFWSSFSSSEERLLECKGLILNLPLTPHRQCTPKYENQHAAASLANTITYRVPSNGYYFFVFNSENEIQPNFLRVLFDLQKTMYNTSNPVHVCKNSTHECSLPLNFFSGERAVLELPFNGNESQWNQEYVVVSTCEPRTSIYLVCIIAVPLLIIMFAFQ